MVITWWMLKFQFMWNKRQKSWICGWKRKTIFTSHKNPSVSCTLCFSYSCDFWLKLIFRWTAFKSNDTPFDCNLKRNRSDLLNEKIKCVFFFTNKISVFKPEMVNQPIPTHLKCSSTFNANDECSWHTWNMVWLNAPKETTECSTRRQKPKGKPNWMNPKCG